MTVYGFESKIGWYWCDCVEEEDVEEDVEVVNPWKVRERKKWTFGELCEVNKPILDRLGGVGLTRGKCLYHGQVPFVWCESPSYGPLPINYDPPCIYKNIYYGPLPLPRSSM